MTQHLPDGFYWTHQGKIDECSHDADLDSMLTEYDEFLAYDENSTLVFVSGGMATDITNDAHFLICHIWDGLGYPAEEFPVHLQDHYGQRICETGFRRFGEGQARTRAKIAALASPHSIAAE